MPKKEKKAVLDINKTPEDALIEQKNYFKMSSDARRDKWAECYKAYMSYLDLTRNPYLANLFIPKTHEAVELLTAFLVGPNQSINVEPEGKDDTMKAGVMEKWLEFQWRKTLNARAKILIWIKQMIVFGNGIAMCYWDANQNEPAIEVCSITDVFFDAYTPNIQDTPVIRKIVKFKKDVEEDERYNENKKNLLSVGDKEEDEITSLATYDLSKAYSSKYSDKVLLYERWTKEKVQTVGQTLDGWKFLRDEPNDYEFIPFVKMDGKPLPLPNRAYSLGLIEPTLKIQQAFNDTVNEFFDNVSLINNKMAIKRRGSQISPGDLVRRPGGVITVDDIEKDLKWDEVSDIKQSLLELLKFLDSEFQQASMISNLVKGIPGANFATEAQIGQSNIQTLMDMMDENIKDALSKLGQMVVDLDVKYAKQIPSIKVLDDDKEVIFMELKPEEIIGKYDVKVSADRSSATSKIVRQKQLLDFLSIISRDALTLQKYPNLPEKVYRKWLQEAGFGNIDWFFEQQISKQINPEVSLSPENAGKEVPMTGEMPPTGGTYQKPATGEQLSPEAVLKAASAVLPNRPI